jgi:hypothetical protein
MKSNFRFIYSSLSLQPCPDVFWFPMVTEEFTRDLVNLMEIFNRWSGSAHNVSFRYDGFYSFPGNPIKPRYGRLSVGRARRVDPGPGLKFRFYRFRVLKFFYYRVQVRVRKYSINRVRVQKSWTRRALVPGNTYYQRVSLNIFPIPLVPGFNRKPHLIQLYYNIKPKLIFELICLGCTFIRWL